ncbi:hypothetical protein H072_1897 [Dactylellina haptotyla CBS 200.50]|uniref:Uncharacterized protein n=1 Tax=Dactylellina haptotyla (strain CBS 200.50) TaxID=1284197 RepID=S8AME9_DACHA|nr:hypothetical protein H072_1897 [Dactylellina haptotyla CBS 200.50]
MTSDFSKGVMVSLNEHMAQTLLDGMTATIRKEKLDLSLQIKGLELLVDNLESLNAKVVSFMGELKSNKENTFTYEELDLEGLESWDDGGITPADSVIESPKKNVSRIPSPITSHPPQRSRFSSNRLTPLVEEVSLTPQRSFETIASDSLKSKSSTSVDSITIKVEIPSTPPPSEWDRDNLMSAVSTPTPKSEFRQIDPKKIPKRKPVPSQLQIPQNGNNKAFKRKEVPKRMYENGSASVSSMSVNTLSPIVTNGHMLSRSMDFLLTPPITDEECSPICDRENRGSTSITTTPTAVYYPKPRRVKSKQLKIAIPHRKSSAGKAGLNGKPLRTPSSGSIGSAKFQKRAIEDLDRAVRLSFTESECHSAKPVKRADSGRERRKNSVRRKLSLRKKKRRYENGVPRCDSPVLGSFEVVFAAPLSRRR